jgi:spermidine synthase
MEEIKIEIVKTGDPEQLKALFRESNWWSETNDSTAPELINKIIAGSFCFAVAVLGDKIIGMGRAISDGVCDAYILDVAVLPKFRGNGIGVLIMDELIFYLKGKNITWITLISEPKATSFYERYGFSLMKGCAPFILKE